MHHTSDRMTVMSTSTNRCATCPTKAYMQWYNMSNDEVGTGMRTYEWLLLQVEKLMNENRLVYCTL